MAKSIEWKCTHCDRKETRLENSGRPNAGKCPRKQGDQPHTWVQNRLLANKL